MSDNLKYSLLVPCYNAHSYIDGFIENIAALLIPFDEVLFYDDGSTDTTAEILLSKGLNVIKGGINKGPGYSRNKLVSKSTGDWFHFHDIDDLLDPQYLTKTSKIAEEGEFDVILCNVDWLDHKTHRTLMSWKYSNTEINNNPVSYTISNPIGGINGLYRKNKFIEAGGFNTEIRIWEDADVHVKLAGNNARFHVIEEVLALSIRYPASASVDQASGWLIRSQLLAEYYKIFQQKLIRNEIGKQAQLTASALIISFQYNEARKALKLSELCNLKVPCNNSKIWSLLKTILPQILRIELRLIQLKIAFGK